MSHARLRAGLVSGLIAAAATAGALLGIGRRLRSPARPYNVIAAHLLGGNAQAVWGFDTRITVPGMLIHVVGCCVCGIAFVVVRDRFHPSNWVAALEIAAGALGLSLLNGLFFGTGLSALLSLGDLILVYVVLAVALAIGVRLDDRPRFRREPAAP